MRGYPLLLMLVAAIVLITAGFVAEAVADALDRQANIIMEASHG